MKVVFLSNFLNHHQLPFCLAMYEQLGSDFTFVATTSIPEERLALGYADLNHAYPFVICTYDDEEKKQAAYDAATEADVAIIGSAPLSFVQERLKMGKLTFYYAERLYKTGFQWWKLPLRILRFWRMFGRHKSMYLLCASAYTAGDFAKTGTFLKKTYKWGYFPETKNYSNIDQIIEQKTAASILWVARFLQLKHPESVVCLAQKLKEAGVDFQIKMIGTGEQEEQIQQQIRLAGLDSHISMLGAMSPDEVRSHMERSEIFLFTSDRNEGWGAVLNEAMNSGCAVVASDAIGSVHFLMEDGENGLIYKSEDHDDLYRKVMDLLEHPDRRAVMGRNAYATMTELWNAENAAQRLLRLCQALLDGDAHPELFESGPCSKAHILKNKHA